MSNVFIGIDPGMYGAVGVIDNSVTSVFDTPLLDIIKNKKDKKDYDIAAMSSILRPYQGKNVTIYIEDVHAMIGNGNVSSFNFGRGKGLWEGIAWAYGFSVKMVSPQTWKKSFDGLITQRISKDNKPKTKKEKAEAAKAKRLEKAAAKARARTLAGEKCPNLKDRFLKVNSDGRAEAVLIAIYAQQHFEGLSNAK